MEIWPIMYIHDATGIVGMYQDCYTTEADALAEIAILDAQDKGFQYVTKALQLKVTLQ